MSLLPGVGTGVSIVPPHRLDQIIETFGDIFSYIRPDHTLDSKWQTDALVTMPLPFPLALSWDTARQVRRMTCHRLLQPIFEKIFQTAGDEELQRHFTSFGGCFSFRPQRNGTKLSTHSWGIAIDLNPESNPQGSAGKMNPAIVSIFRNAGFTWGGDWQGRTRDPMHFQFCTGY
jgi:D-alanyl-D-alanine carboxypeptidase-like protein